jgi:hypothetical protein
LVILFLSQTKYINPVYRGQRVFLFFDGESGQGRAGYTATKLP